MKTAERKSKLPGIKSYEQRLGYYLNSQLALKNPVDILVLKEVVKNHSGLNIQLKSMEEDGTGKCEIFKNVETKKGAFRRSVETRKEIIAEVGGSPHHDGYHISYSAEAIPLVSEYLEKKYKWKTEDREKAKFILQGKL